MLPIDRSKLRYPSDLTDEEWALARPEIPRAKRGGNKLTVDARGRSGDTRPITCEGRGIIPTIAALGPNRDQMI